MDINQYIRQRRTIKPEKFTTEIIPDEVIEQILENANWAPTHGFTEPWRFWVFAGQSLQQLATFHSELYKRVTPETEFKDNTYQKLYERPLKASHVIAIGMRRGEKPKIPALEEVEATACAVQNMWLTAAAYGVGGYWNSGGMTYHAEMKIYFELGAEDQFLGFLYLGYPGEDWPQGKRITSIQSKTQLITNQ